jgi:hypothetical protein
MLFFQEVPSSDASGGVLQSSLSSVDKGKSVGGSTLDPTEVFGDLTANSNQLLGIFKDIGDVNTAIVTDAQKLANTMGIGQARAGQLQMQIANTVPEMLKLGITTDESFKVLSQVPVALGTNTTIANKTIIELGTAAKISGVEAKDLAVNFRNVGMELGQVAQTMADVANYAKSVGVNVELVSGAVSKNLKQLNLFNFENGVKGLASMAAQSAMLGVNMDKVFTKAESLLSPESAIEFSSALQRLGVASTELLDPLSAMDMAMNNPEKLSSEMVKVAQQFTKLKADGSGFEILPGAKLQLREVAKELGMDADELANMAIRSSELDMKLKQIKFPSFAASEEDRMLIANMAQMKEGRAVVQLESGEEVAVEDLTAEQLKELQKDQANQNKSAEEIALDQLNVLEKIQANTQGGILSAKVGVATAGPIRRYTETINQTRLAMVENTLGKVTTSGVRETTEKVSEPLEKALIDFVKNPSLASLGDIGLSFKDVGSNLVTEVGELAKTGEQSITDIANQLSKSIGKIYGNVGTEGQAVTGGGGFQNLVKDLTDEKKFKELEQYSNKNSTSTNNINVNQKMEVTLKSDGSVTSDQLTNLIKTDQFTPMLLNSLQNDTQVQNEVDAQIKKRDNMNK